MINRHRQSVVFRGRVHGRNGQVSVIEGSVRQSVTEWKQGLCAVMLVAAVAHKYAFLVDDAIASRLRVVAVVHWIVFPAAFESRGQTARGIHVAKQNFCSSFAAFLPWIPSFQKRWDALDPCVHVRAAAGGEHDDRFFVRGRHFLDQLILSWRQMKGAVSAFGFGLRIKSHRDYNYIRLRRQLLRIGKNIGSYACDSHMQASAEPFGLAVMLENNFVGSAVESKRRDTQYFLRTSPIVEHDFVVNEDAVIAAVFSRGRHEEIVFAGSTRRVVTGH